jgi:hypothetical protein
MILVPVSIIYYVTIIHYRAYHSHSFLFIVIFYLIPVAPSGAQEIRQTPFLSCFLMLWTVGRTPRTWDQPIARPLPTQDNADRHPCFEWDSKPRSQCARGLRPAATVIGIYLYTWSHVSCHLALLFIFPSLYSPNTYFCIHISTTFKYNFVTPQYATPIFLLAAYGANSMSPLPPNPLQSANSYFPPSYSPPGFPCTYFCTYFRLPVAPKTVIQC